MSSEGKITDRLLPLADTWEYRVILYSVDNLFSGSTLNPHSLRDVLDEAGADGWELVNTVEINRGHALLFILKRPRGRQAP